MKTKKLITLLALLIAGLFVSAQSYMDQESVRFEKARLDALNQQINLSDFNTGYLDRTWTLFTSTFDYLMGIRTGNFSKENQNGEYPSAYVQFFEENGYPMIEIEDNSSLPRKVHYPGTPEFGRKPIVP